MPPEVAVAGSDNRLNTPARLPNRTFTVGIIGAGDIARSAHLPVLRAMPFTKVAWITDLDNARAQSIGRAYKIPAIALPKNPADLPPSDIVLMTTPYGVREPYYETLQARDCSVYVEKPIALTTSEHRDLCSRFPPYALTSGLMMRCWGANQLMRKLIAAKLFGPLRAVRFGFGHPGLVTGGRYYFDPERGGAGMVAEVGIHGLDTMLFVTGAASAMVRDVRVVRKGGLDLHTEAQLTLVPDTGGTVSCQVTVTAAEDVEEGLQFEFDHAIVSYPLPGQGYALHGDSIDMRVHVRSKDISSKDVGSNVVALEYALEPAMHRMVPETKFQMFYDYWRRFLCGVAEGEANWTSAESALLTTQVMQNICEAAC